MDPYGTDSFYKKSNDTLLGCVHTTDNRQMK